VNVLPAVPTYAARTCSSAFFHAEWLFEVKWDGFRALAYVHKGECQLITRNGNQFKLFPALNDAIPAELSARSAILDGEIVCLDHHGKSQLHNLRFRNVPRIANGRRATVLVDRRVCLLKRRGPAAQ
jgi:ATP-dependent DNA ligase